MSARTCYLHIFVNFHSLGRKNVVDRSNDHEDNNSNEAGYTHQSRQKFSLRYDGHELDLLIDEDEGYSKLERCILKAFVRSASRRD